MTENLFRPQQCDLSAQFVFLSDQVEPVSAWTEQLFSLHLRYRATQRDRALAIELFGELAGLLALEEAQNDDSRLLRRLVRL